MFIKLIILEGKRDKNNYSKPTEYIYKGNYAVEQMLIKITEIYFGSRVSSQFEDLLKMRLSDEEIAINLLRSGN